MHQFKDGTGQSWTVCINVLTIERVRAGIGVNIHELIQNEMRPLAELCANSWQLVQCLYVLCEGQITERGLTPDQFAALFAGDVLEDAKDAFVDELVFFIPNRKARETLRRALKESKTVGEKVIERANKKLDAIDPEKIADSVLEKLNDSSGNSLAKSA